MNKKYTAEELDLLHTELYDILGETIRVCQKHDIPYFVIGGTAIGALYDQDPIYASTINVMTTLVSIITMPLMVMLYLA